MICISHIRLAVSEVVNEVAGLHWHGSLDVELRIELICFRFFLIGIDDGLAFFGLILDIDIV